MTFLQQVRLLDYSILEKYDPGGMHKIYDQWPQIAKESYQSNLDSVDNGNLNHIVFAGMGGSGVIGDVFSAILSETKIHVDVVKGYVLPKTVGTESLVVASSISGNTRETLAILESARKLNCKIVGFSEGGKMQEYCVKNKIEHRVIPQIHSPRASFPSFFYSILNVLDPFIKWEKNDVLKSISHLEELCKKISSSNLSSDNPSLSLAEWISGIPLMYYPRGLHPAAIRFKNSLQENSKQHVIIEEILEATHNGIVAWEKESNIQPILVEGQDDHIKTKERWKIIKEYFGENKIDYKEVASVKGSILSKIINLIYLLDYCTIYLAVKSKIDPSPIRSLNYVKDRLT